MYDAVARELNSRMARFFFNTTRNFTKKDFRATCFSHQNYSNARKVDFYPKRYEDANINRIIKNIKSSGLTSISNSTMIETLKELMSVENNDDGCITSLTNSSEDPYRLEFFFRRTS